MTISVVPSEFDTFKALRVFLQSILPETTDVIRGQVNRVPRPSDENYVVMWPLRREPQSTSIDEFVDARMAGSIASDILTVDDIDYGAIKIGSEILGVGVLPGTTVIRQVNGTGADGTYAVSKPQSISTRVLAAGVLNVTVATEVTIQIDVHGPAGGDNAQRILNMLRDDYAFVNMTRQNLGVYPLTCEPPRQVVFQTDENQVEDRWVVEACLQINATVKDIPQEFFDQIVVGLINVDTKYPAI